MTPVVILFIRYVTTLREIHILLQDITSSLLLDSHMKQQSSLFMRMPSTSNTRVALKVMPPIYFLGNSNRYKEHNNTF
jgi:hypothetical protein